MARKYELISELYDRTCKTVVSNPQNWQNFLQSACRNYKLRFDEQLLIFAQRPDKDSPTTSIYPIHTKADIPVLFRFGI